jgi:hypothetical protein
MLLTGLAVAHYAAMLLANMSGSIALTNEAAIVGDPLGGQYVSADGSWRIAGTAGIAYASADGSAMATVYGQLADGRIVRLSRVSDGVLAEDGAASVADATSALAHGARTLAANLPGAYVIDASQLAAPDGYSAVAGVEYGDASAASHGDADRQYVIDATRASDGIIVEVDAGP